MRRLRLSAGFTLIELLVVIAIIAVLIALLLPAIQAAREAANRARCTNNLKQLGLAFQNYHDSNNMFPPGSHVNSGGGWGRSFFPSLLPYIDQEPLYDRFNMDLSVGVGYDVQCNALGTTYSQILIDTLLCPSSPLPQRVTSTCAQSTAASYVGISGAAFDVNTFPATLAKNFAGTHNSCCSETPIGWNTGLKSMGGILLPHDGLNGNASMCVKIGEIVDGTSKVMILGETSDFSFFNGTPRNISPSWPHGWMMGKSNGTTERHFNLTTVRYPIGTRDYNLPGIAENHGANNPLLSAHNGGCNVLLCDGSVSFLGVSTDMNLLRQLATRDDRQQTGSF